MRTRFNGGRIISNTEISTPTPKEQSTTENKWGEQTKIVDARYQIIVKRG